MFIIYFLLPPIFLVLAKLLREKNTFSIKSLLCHSFLISSIASILFCYITVTLTHLSFSAMLSFTPITLLVAFISSFFFATVKLLFEDIKQTKSTLTCLLAALCIALFLEGTVFNMRSYQTYYYEPVDLTEKTDFSPTFVKLDGTSNKYVANPGSTVNFEIPDLNIKIHNIYFDLRATGASGDVIPITLRPSFTDESNELYLSTPTQTVTDDVKSTKYLYFVTNGKSEKIKFSFSSDATNYTLNGIYANAPKPFEFNTVRIFVAFLAIFAAFLLRPKSKIYDCKLSFSSRQRAIIFAVIFLEIILLIAVSTFNPAFKNYVSSHHAQYNQLAQSFLNGKLHLEIEPPAYLAEMENPYDYYARSRAATEHGKSYYWDAAYYDGHYYVYFGVLPVLLFYLPFKAVTGLDLENRAVIQICLAFFVLGAFLLIEKIIKKYFDPSKIPFVSYLALSLIFVNASGAVFIAKRPDFYSIPIILSLALVMFGLYFWLRSTDNKDKIGIKSAFFGSLFMALVAASRPQFLLASILAIVIFWSSVFKDRTLFSKKSLTQTVAICLPYLAVAAALMWYNFARFGSPFDFGQNYNLTTNDMTGRGFRVERVGLSFFTYFLQPPKINAAFPFVNRVDITTSYLGTTITEAMFGGIFAVIPLLWILFLVPSMTKKLKEKKLFYPVVILTALSVFIGLFDAQGAGLLQRYVADFSYLAILAAILVMLVLYERSRGARTLQLNAFTTFSLYASSIYSFLMIFAIYGTEIYYKNYSLFASVASMIEFWK